MTFYFKKNQLLQRVENYSFWGENTFYIDNILTTGRPRVEIKVARGLKA